MRNTRSKTAKMSYNDRVVLRPKIIPKQEEKSKTKQTKVNLEKLIKKTLEQWSKNTTPLLHRAVKLKDLKITKYLLNVRKVDVNSVNELGYTATYYATSENLKLLIKKGADVNFPGPRKLTPLRYALKRNRPYNVLKVLISNGADVNILYQNRVTILGELYSRHKRYGDSYLQLIDLALSMGGNINATFATLYKFVTENTTYKSFIQYWPYVDHEKLYKIQPPFVQALENNFTIEQLMDKFKLMFGCSGIEYAVERFEYYEYTPFYKDKLQTILEQKVESLERRKEIIRFFVKRVPIKMTDIQSIVRKYSLTFIVELLGYCNFKHYIRNQQLEDMIRYHLFLINPNIDVFLVQPDRHERSIKIKSILYRLTKYTVFNNHAVYRKFREFLKDNVYYMSNPAPLNVLARDAIRRRLFQNHGWGHALFSALDREARKIQQSNGLGVSDNLYDIILLKQPITHLPESFKYFFQHELIYTVPILEIHEKLKKIHELFNSQFDDE